MFSNFINPTSIRWMITCLILFSITACNSSEPTPDPTTVPTPTNPALVPTDTPAPDESQEKEPAIVPTVSETDASSSSPAPKLADTALLPAPLYFLNGAGQIVRLEVNGLTLTPITVEPEPITDFDVSPTGDRLAYVSNNSLIIADGAGANRIIAVAGEPLNPDNFGEAINKAIDNIHFSPDGSQIAFGLNGVNLIRADRQNEAQLIQGSDPVPDLSSGSPPPADAPPRFFWPEAWSPDGSRLLIRFAYFPEGGGLAVKNLADDALVEISNGDNQVCCYAAWDQGGQAVYFASDITQFAAPGLWRADVQAGTSTTLLDGQPPQEDEPFTLISYPHHTRQGDLLAFVTQTPDPAFAPNPTLHRVSVEGAPAELAQLRQDFYTIGDLLWAADDSGAIIVDISTNRQFPIKGPMVWLPTDGRPVLDLPAHGSHPRWGGPAQSTTAVPFPTAADFAALETDALASFGIAPVEAGDEAGGIAGIRFRQFNTGDDARSLWVVFTEGLRSFEPEQNHTVAIYAFDQNGWQEISKLTLSEGTGSEALSPDYIGEGSVTQVFIEPTRRWLIVEGGAGAHSGIFQLLSFDNQTLQVEATNFNSSPGAGRVADLNSDGVLEVLLDLTDPYIFYYAAGVQFVHFDVLRWDDAAQEFIEVPLTALPGDAPAALRNWNNRALELAQAGLWKDALETIEEAIALDPHDEIVAWNEAVIRLNAESKRDVFSPYPILDQIFYGDYATAVEVMRTYPAEEIFTAETPLVIGTPAEGSEEILSEIILTRTSDALELQPELAPAYFLRGWAHFLSDPASPDALADLERAAQLAPDDPLYVSSVDYLQNK